MKDDVLGLEVSSRSKRDARRIDCWAGSLVYYFPCDQHSETWISSQFDPEERGRRF